MSLAMKSATACRVGLSLSRRSDKAIAGASSPTAALFTNNIIANNRNSPRSYSSTASVHNQSGGKHHTPTSFATKCASLYGPSKGGERALAPPIYFGSTFLLDDADHGARLHDKKEGPWTDDDGFVYSRWGSPTNEAAARQIAALEGIDDDDEERGAGTMLFGSGMSAITSCLMATLKSGDHAVFPYTVYGGTHEFLKDFAVHWGIDVTFVDGAGREGPAAYRDAMRDNTKVVYAETPANPTCRLTDLRGVGAAVDERYGTRADNPRRPWVMVDGTFATPYHQRSLDVPGIDVSIHSATKYLGGHSDITAGTVTSRSPIFKHELAKAQKLITAPLNPMDSYLLIRGLRTLDVRMQRHGENAVRVARMLDSHPMVEATYYPGLTSHPDHTACTECLVADSFRSGRDVPEDAEYMPQTYGGMIAFTVKGEGDVALKCAKAVCENLNVFNLAVSLGSVESLVEHPASMTHAMVPREDRLAGGLHDGLIRISVGLERASDLVEDLRQSLDRCQEEDDEEGSGGAGYEDRVYASRAM